MRTLVIVSIKRQRPYVERFMINWPYPSIPGTFLAE